MNRSRSKTQAGGGTKKGEGRGSSPPEKTQEATRSADPEKERDAPIEVEDRSSQGKNKEPVIISSDQGRDDVEETTETKEG